MLINIPTSAITAGLQKHCVCIIYRKTNTYLNFKLLMLYNCIQCYDFSKYQLQLCILELESFLFLRLQINDDYCSKINEKRIQLSTNLVDLEQI